MQEIDIIDSHTGGEPTRVAIAGSPDLGHGSLTERFATLRTKFDSFRRTVVNEPRGSEVLVGALLLEPDAGDSAAAVIFFNNVGYLGMCGHGTIGLAATLHAMGRLSEGKHLLETPAGPVSFTLHDANSVSVENVASYRYRKDVEVDVPDIGLLRGDIAWGGNWFFLVSGHDQELELANTEALTDYTWAIREALEGQGIHGPNGELIDHVELFGPPRDSARADSRNFVLCPGKAYDRSPCGTGTSAKLACLIEDGKVKPGAIWRQESITGSVFEARGEHVGNVLRPTITGTAYLTGRGTLVVDERDPLRTGLQP